MGLQGSCDKEVAVMETFSGVELALFFTFGVTVAFSVGFFAGSHGSLKHKRGTKKPKIAD